MSIPDYSYLVQTEAMANVSARFDALAVELESLAESAGSYADDADTPRAFNIANALADLDGMRVAFEIHHAKALAAVLAAKAEAEAEGAQS